MPLIAALGISTVAALERLQPYELEWLADHDDTGVDVMHALFSLTLIFTSVHLVTIMRTFLPLSALWPT